MKNSERYRGYYLLVVQVNQRKIVIAKTTDYPFEDILFDILPLFKGKIVTGVSVYTYIKSKIVPTGNDMADLPPL